MTSGTCFLFENQKKEVFSMKEEIGGLLHVTAKLKGGGRSYCS